MVRKPPRSAVIFGRNRWLAPLLLLGPLGCQAIVDTTIEQCRTDDDCTAPASWCTEDRLCTTQCVRHGECQRFGETFACISERCTDVTSNECPTVIPDGILSDDRTLLFGFITSADDYGLPLAEGAELALREIDAEGQTLPPASSDDKTRKLALVMCSHDPRKTDEALTAARHLQQVVQAPAIVGGSYSGVTRSIAEELATDGVLLVSPSATSPGLSGTRGSQNAGIRLGLMVRRTAPSDTVQAELIKWLVRDVVSALVSTGELTSESEARVSAVVKDDLAGQGLFDAVTTVDESRGQAAAPAIGNLKYETYGETTTDWQSVADAIGETRPHVILGLGTGEFAEHVLPLLEEINPTPKPWYVLPEGNRLDGLVALAESHPDWGLESRLVGSAPGARTSSRYNNFAARFDNAFEKAPGNLAEFAYDTVYWLAYGILLSGEHYPSGEQLARAMQRVTCKDEGALENPEKPTEFYAFASSLTPDSCFDFEGVSGPLDFDEATGDADSDVAMWCLRNNDDSLTFEPNLNDYYSVSNNSVVRCQEPALDFSQSEWCPAARATAPAASCQ